MSRSPLTIPYPVLLVIVVVGAIVLLATQPVKPILSSWTNSQPGQVVADSVSLAFQGTAAETAPKATILGQAKPMNGEAPLTSFLQSSSVQENVADGRVQFVRRDVAGGSVDLFVVRLDDQTHVEVLNADGATPGSDASGDTIWTDGQQHLATVQEMTNAPYAAREGHQLLGAIAFGFHGDIRTSDEGSIVINSTVLRSNPGRASLCITPQQAATIDRFSTEQLANCAQAIGGGPVILWNGKIANPDVQQATDEFMPFNPLNEDFIQLDWRKQIYSGLYPKTAVGVGILDNGASYLVLATSYNLSGIDLARQLRDMGCYSALGGDDDTSTQSVWRGALTRPTNPREVPDAIAVYLKQ